MNLPSVKTLAQIADNPKRLRAVLELSSRATAEVILNDPELNLGDFEATAKWVRSCYHYPSLHELKMNMADELCRTHGVEFIPQGKGANSPAIEYLNAVDPYAVTLLWVKGRYRVGCWGDIVERGHYD